MRIAFLAWESLHSIPVGGVAVHVTELAAALERKGHEVHVFTRMRAGQPQYERIHGVHYHRCGFQLHPDFVQEIGKMCQSFVHHVLQTEDYIGPFDVIHAHDWLTANAMIWLKQARGRKTVLTIHSTEYGRSGNRFLEGRSGHVRDQERAATYWADRVISVSHSLKKEVMWMYEAPEWKISTIYNGVNAHDYDGWIHPGEVRARYGIGAMDPTILYSGRLVYQKGPDLLVEAIPWLVKCQPSAKFIFAGDGEMRPKPVVVSKNGGPDEYVWHEVNGLKIYPNPNSVAWGIGTLFTNFEWARWMGRNGRMAAEAAFSWDSVANHVAQVYIQ